MRCPKFLKILSPLYAFVCCICVTRVGKVEVNFIMLLLTFIDNPKDKTFFENLFYSYRKQMLCLANSYLHNTQDAEDIVHDVFLKIAQNHLAVIKNFKNEADIRNYLLKAVKNTAINRIRKRKKYNTISDTLIEFGFADTPDLADNCFVDKICNDMEYGQIIDAIKSLNETYKTALYYHFVLEIPIPKVAKILDQSLSTTKKQLVRGKKMLLKLLETKGE